MKKIVDQHWFCVVALLPFIALFVVHEALGMPDVVTIKIDNDHEAERGFTFLMVLALYFGAAGFAVHVVWLLPRGTAWLALKIFILALAWYALSIYFDSKLAHRVQKQEKAAVFLFRSNWATPSNSPKNVPLAAE